MDDGGVVQALGAAVAERVTLVRQPVAAASVAPDEPQLGDVGARGEGRDAVLDGATGRSVLSPVAFPALEYG